MAAETIINANKNYTSQNLLPYEQLITQRYGEKDYNRKSILPTSIRHSLGKLILNNRRLSRGIVIERWFLHTHQQPLKISYG